jgi:methionyl-tRNA formyltransferase
MPLDLENGSYFSGRKPEDGRIDWRLPVRDIHNLIRAVAPPYPGAFFDIHDHHIEVLGSYIRDEQARFSEPCIYIEDGRFQADGFDGRRFMITHLVIDGTKADAALFEQTFGQRLVLDGETDT